MSETADHYSVYACVCVCVCVRERECVSLIQSVGEMGVCVKERCSNGPASDEIFRKKLVNKQVSLEPWSPAW